MPEKESGWHWPFAQMQKTTAGTAEIRLAGPFGYWRFMWEKILGTGCYRDFKTILKQGFADLRGAQEGFLQICKKFARDQRTGKTIQEMAAKRAAEAAALNKQSARDERFRKPGK